MVLMKNGWYQRQFRDFPPDKPRLDTAIICDKSTLNFAVDCDHTYDSVIWQVDKLTKQGKVERVIIREDFEFAKLHKWQHQFIVDEDKDIAISQRDRYTNYKVYSLLRHPCCAICPEDRPVYDTLTTVVRVMRSYDDTIPKVICAGDETSFFADKSHVETINSTQIPQVSELGLLAERQPTTFIADASVKGEQKVDDFTYRIGLGTHYFKRKYETWYGCDSIVTLNLTIIQDCKAYDTVRFCRGYNTEHEEIAGDGLIRRYLPYVFQSPSEWDYMDGVILEGEHDRTLVDLRRAEKNLYNHYVGELTPVSSIRWSVLYDNQGQYVPLTVTNEPQWIATGHVAVQVYFLCGEMYNTEFPTDIDRVSLETVSTKRIENGRVVIIRGGAKYDLFGTKIQ